MMQYNLTNLSEQETKLLWAGLLELPAKHSFDLLLRLKGQLEEQERFQREAGLRFAETAQGANYA